MSNQIERAEAFRQRNHAYVRTQDRRRIRSHVEDYVRQLAGRVPPVPGAQRAAEHLIRAATTLLLLTLLAPGAAEVGIPTIAEMSDVSQRTAVRAGVWLRNYCRVLNRPYRGREGLGVNKYVPLLELVTDIADRLRADSKQRQRRGLEWKRMRDNKSADLCATSSQVAPALPAGKGVVGLGQRMAEHKARLARLIGTAVDDCEHGNPPNACAWCRRQSF